MRLTALAVTLLLGACATPPAATVPAPQDPLAKAALLRLEQDWCEATLGGDSAGVARIEDEAFVRTDAQGNNSSREDELKDIEAHAVEYSRYENRDETVRLSGDTAVVSGVRLLEGWSGDLPFKLELRFTDTFARRAGGWKAVAARTAHLERPG